MPGERAAPARATMKSQGRRWAGFTVPPSRGRGRLALRRPWAMDAVTCLVYKMTRHEAGRAHLLPLFPGQRSRPPLRALPDDGRRVPHPPRLLVPARGPSRRVSVRLEEGTRPARIPDRLHLVRPATPGSGPDALPERLRQLLPALSQHLAPLTAGPSH